MKRSGYVFRLFLVGLVISILPGIASFTRVQASSHPPSHQGGSRNASSAGSNTLTIQVIPPLAGVEFALNGEVFESDNEGLARITAPGPGTYEIEYLSTDHASANFRAEFQRWERDIFSTTRTISLPRTSLIAAGFEVTYPIDLEFVDLSGNSVDAKRIDSITMKSSNGVTYAFEQGEPIWLKKNRIVQRLDGLDDVDLTYSIQNIQVDGSNVVNQGQQRFEVVPGKPWQIELLLFTATFLAKEAVFGYPLGEGVEIQYPDGRTMQYSFRPGGELKVDGLARGTYLVQVVGASGFSMATPMVLSRNQEVELQVFSYLTVTLAILTPIIGALAILMLGRLRYRWIQRRDASLLLWLLIPVLFFLPTHRAHAQGTAAPADGPIPVFAYYYIWYQEGSWERAKTDYPLLGRYTSDDEAVMLQHIQWAKQAGIDGFIVSWRSTDELNPRLEKLIELSEKEDFKLMVIYQGLSYERRPRPIHQVMADFDYFITNYASSTAFDVFDKPVIMWNGTWEYSLKDIETLTSTRRQHLRILATQKNVEDYLLLAKLFDGDAYYWSSVNPYTNPNYHEKLDEMGQAVHDQGGIWIPSAAVGFDARMVGGRRVIPRSDGMTLQILLETAFDSSPDAIGVISWNEFSENTHIEPSEKHGTQYLDVLTDFLNSPPPPVPPLYDSNEPDPIAYEPPAPEASTTGNIFLSLGSGRISSLLFLVMLIGTSFILIVTRRTKRQ